MIRRAVLGFLFGCGHFSVVYHPYLPLWGVHRCSRRAAHVGAHAYPDGWVETKERR